MTLPPRWEKILACSATTSRRGPFSAGIQGERKSQELVVCNLRFTEWINIINVTTTISYIIHQVCRISCLQSFCTYVIVGCISQVHIIIYLTVSMSLHLDTQTGREVKLFTALPLHKGRGHPICFIVKKIRVVSIYWQSWIAGVWMPSSIKVCTQTSRISLWVAPELYINAAFSFHNSVFMYGLGLFRRQNTKPIMIWDAVNHAHKTEKTLLNQIPLFILSQKNVSIILKCLIFCLYFLLIFEFKFLFWHTSTEVQFTFKFKIKSSPVPFPDHLNLFLPHLFSSSPSNSSLFYL